MIRSIVPSVYLAALALLFAACSGPKAAPPTCNTTYDCGAGQTCWTTDDTNYTCQQSGPAALGASCNPDASATAPCADGLACLQLDSAASGICTGWCDATHPCPSEQACVILSSRYGVDLRVCSLSDPASCAFAYSCGAGETCWTQDGFVFQCTAAGALTLGAACDPTDTAALCADGLVCLGAGDGTGTCTAWCGADGSCPSGSSCAAVGTTHGVTVRVCR